SRSRNPKLVRRSTVTASVTNGRALRYAEGSARGLLHHVLGHCRPTRNLGRQDALSKSRAL
ncbi:hypothetical protein, partial [Paracoccus shanxieyensis]|uniref:hypothetical protein n=1 Tax=Paracoccus shanxieyensis TaxID=2675752 RepID=UPI001E53F57E